jgi:hypothetical protein
MFFEHISITIIRPLNESDAINLFNDSVIIILIILFLQCETSLECHDLFFLPVLQLDYHLHGGKTQHLSAMTVILPSNDVAYITEAHMLCSKQFLLFYHFFLTSTFIVCVGTFLLDFISL